MRQCRSGWPESALPTSEVHPRYWRSSASRSGGKMWIYASLRTGVRVQLSLLALRQKSQGLGQGAKEFQEHFSGLFELGQFNPFVGSVRLGDIAGPKNNAGDPAF